MRVYEVINVRWFNATAWYAIIQARLLAAHGHEVMVVCLPDSPAHLKALEYGLPVATLDLNTTSPLGIVRLYARMRKLLREFPPEIVNCHRGEAFVLWGLLKLQSRGLFRLVRTRGDQRPPKNNRVNRWLHRSLADAVVCTNSAMARHFRDILGLPASHLWLIFGGVDRDRFKYDPEGRHTVRQRYGFGPQHKVVGLLGRFDRVKGQWELLQAVSRLYHDGMSDLRVLLIGFTTATSQAEVEGWIQDLGLTEVVHITGLTEDVPACLSALDLGIVNSLWSETIARAALETMSCSVPLIGTTVGVLPDLLSQEALVPPGDSGALADRIRDIFSDQSLVQRLHKQQEETIRDLSTDHFVQHTQSLYTRLLSPDR